MTTYLIRRTLQGIMVLFFASSLIYLLLDASGGPLSQLNGQSFRNAGEKQAKLKELKKKYHLVNLDNSERNVLERYAAWLFNVDPEGDSDPYFLQNKIDAANRVIASTKPGSISYTQQQLALQDAQSKIGKAAENLGACKNLFSGDNFGKCMSVQRVGGILSGNWGTSLTVANNEPVLQLIFGKPGEHLRSSLANTLVLLTLSLLLSLLIALPIGIYSAVKQYSITDYTVTTLSFFGLSMPSFWFGLMLILIFSLWLGWLPSGDIVDHLENKAEYGDIGVRLRHLIMPLAVLTITSIAGWSRFLRASMLEVLRQDYVRTAWAKGLRQRAVIMKHALRNALIPLVTLMALAVPGLFGGAIITERIFNYPGMGTLYFHAIGRIDWPVAMAFLLISSFLVILGNMFADVAYALVDPRIRY